MKEIYDWVGWFRELGRAIRSAGEDGLITQASQVDWGGKPDLPELLKNGDQGIDPFSFLYSLAQKNTKHQRPRVYPSVAECFGLEAPPDPGNEDLYAFPAPPPMAPAVFNNRIEFKPDLLWRLFRQAVENEPQIDPELFRDVLEIQFVAIKKLTHTLCLINPDYFVPADALQHLPANRGTDLKRWDHAEYVSAMDKAKRTFPGCRAYEINAFVWLQYMLGSPLITAESRYFQVSTRAYEGDRWTDFDRSYAVYTDASRPGGPAGSWSEETIDGEPLRDPYPLAEPKRGDVILVRAGYEGRAIGVVHSNDYAEPDGLNERSRLHVYWINKAPASFAGAQTDQKAFAHTQPGSSTYRAFAMAALYEPTFALIDKARSSDKPIPPKPPPIPPPFVHPMNLVLYGPPGTGKTWHTVTRAVAIVEARSVHEVLEEEREDRAAVKRRFNEYRQANRIEMVTFHQNTTYQDFVEGIRPVLINDASAGADGQAEPQNVGDVQYELSRGVFRRITECAEQDPDQRYVLVIDEINRGNIAAIFGELITLIEDSKRIGRDDETRVTLPGSKTELGVPANLHVVGTMNTADRSIALLDTALRRRFVFEEMMPDASHPGISTDADGVNCRDLLAAMNRRIAVLLDREHQIGHTYFLGVDTLAVLASTFRTRILPLLQEYFYDDWEKIRAVLNDNGFVQKSDPPEELVRADLVDAGRVVYDYRPSDDQWTTATSYQAIYEPKVSREDGNVAPGA